jgi:hypothetical protein
MPKKTKTKHPLPELYMRATVIVKQTESNQKLMADLMHHCQGVFQRADGDPILKLSSECIQGVCLPKQSQTILDEMPPLQPKTEQPKKDK